MKKFFSFFVGIVLSFLFLYLLFKNVNIRLLKNSFLEVKFFWLLPVVFLTFFEVFLRALKWKAILFHSVKAEASNLFKFQVMALSVNNILPFRIGELVKAVLIARKYSISYIFSFSTVIIERIVDMIVLVLVFIFIIFHNSNIFDISPYKKILFLPAVLVITFLVSLIFVDKIKKIFFVSKFLSRYKKIEKVLDKVSLAVLCFRDLKTAFLVFFSCFCQWIINAINYYFIAEAFSIKDKISFIKGVALVFISALAASLPSMPGYFGNIEFAISKIMTNWAVTNEKALAFAFLSHFINYVSITVLGLIFIYRMGYSLGSFMREDDKIILNQE